MVYQLSPDSKTLSALGMYGGRGGGSLSQAKSNWHPRKRKLYVQRETRPVRHRNTIPSLPDGNSRLRQLSKYTAGSPGVRAGSVSEPLACKRRFHHRRIHGAAAEQQRSLHTPGSMPPLS